MHQSRERDLGQQQQDGQQQQNRQLAEQAKYQEADQEEAVDGDAGHRRQPQVQDGHALAIGPPTIGPEDCPGGDADEGSEGDQEGDAAAARRGVDQRLDGDERHQADQEQREGRGRHQQLQPLPGRTMSRGLAQPSGHEAEADRHEQPGVEVAPRHTEPAIGRTDADPCPQPHANGDRVEAQVQADGQQAVHHRRISASHAQRVGDAHGTRDDQRPGEADDDRCPIDLQHPGRVVVVGLEDELVALLEQDAEGGGADQFQEGESPAPQGGDGSANEEGGGADLQQQVGRIHRWPDHRTRPVGA